MEPSKTEKEGNVIEERGNEKSPATFIFFSGILEWRTIFLVGIVFFIVFFSATVSLLLMPPKDFPSHKIIKIKNGDSLSVVSDTLSKENIIRSRYFFEGCAKIVGGMKPVIAGEYLFEEPVSACVVALRVARGLSGVPEVRVTLPEGVPNVQVADIIKKNIPEFDEKLFIEIAKKDEGFLFPDTYLFIESVTPEKVVSVMIENFNKKMMPFDAEIKASGHSLREVVTMASILEKEATSDEDKAIVSGVLWKRISIGMPLQVDASFLYLLGKKSSEVTVDDMQIRSGYNTYTNKGLPSGPIGNPGLIAIQSALRPTASAYLFYLSDNNGVMHYAKTFEEHKANKLKYLR